MNYKKIWILQLKDIVKEYRDHFPTINQVGLSFPGPVDIHGNIQVSLNLWGQGTFPIEKETLQKEFGLPLTISDDISSYAFKYVGDEDLKSYVRLAIITISTGVSARIYDRKAQSIMVDSKNRGSSIGQIVIKKATALNPKKTLSDFVSGRKLLDFTISLLNKDQDLNDHFKTSQLNIMLELLNKDLTTIESEEFNKILSESFKKEDRVAYHIVDKSLEVLASSLQAFILTARPEKIIIRGGIANGFGEGYQKLLLKKMQEDWLPFGYEAEDITKMICFSSSSFTDGLIGIANLINKNQTDNEVSLKDSYRFSIKP